MNKKQLVSNVAEVLRGNGVRKYVSFPKQTFRISDTEGNTKDFVVRQTDKEVLYTVEDVGVVIDACLSVAQDAIKRGEEVNLKGFGSLGLHYRAPRKTKRPGTDEWVDVKGRYVPKFTFGNSLRMAARVYEMSLDDFDIDEDIYEEVDSLNGA